MAIAGGKYGPWTAEFEAFQAADERQRPAEGGILFTGSSSIRLWHSLARDLPRHAVINRGFGGSRVIDSVEHVELLVLQYRPRVVVLYAGGNDLAHGMTAEAIANDVDAFFQRVHSALPNAQVGLIQHALQPARRPLWPAVRELTRLERILVAQDARRHFISVGAPLENPNGEPDEDCFVSDKIHLSRKGYAAWTLAVNAWLDQLPV